MRDLLLAVSLGVFQACLVALAYRMGLARGERKGAKRNLETIAQWRATIADARQQERVLVLLAQHVRSEAPHIITEDLVQQMAAINGSEEVN